MIAVWSPILLYGDDNPVISDMHHQNLITCHGNHWKIHKCAMSLLTISTNFHHTVLRWHRLAGHFWNVAGRCTLEVQQIWDSDFFLKPISTFLSQHWSCQSFFCRKGNSDKWLKDCWSFTVKPKQWMCFRIQTLGGGSNAGYFCLRRYVSSCELNWKLVLFVGKSILIAIHP